MTMTIGLSYHATQVDVRQDDLADPEVQRLILDHSAEMHRQSPAGFARTWAIDCLRMPQVTVWTAWLEGRLCGCAALRELQQDSGEIKSMRTRAGYERRGVGSALLHQIIGASIRRRYASLYLETGSGPAFEAACSFYLRHGFRTCAPFAEHVENGRNLCMVRNLWRSEPR